MIVIAVLTVLISMLPLTIPQSLPSAVSGTWKVVGHLEPGISALDKAQADSWIGKKARYEGTVAEFDTDRCTAPGYTSKTVDADQFFADGFRVRARSLGIEASKIVVVEVACNGSNWIAPGS